MFLSRFNHLGCVVESGTIYAREILISIVKTEKHATIEEQSAGLGKSQFIFAVLHIDWVLGSRVEARGMA